MGRLRLLLVIIVCKRGIDGAEDQGGEPTNHESGPANDRPVERRFAGGPHQLAFGLRAELCIDRIFHSPPIFFNTLVAMPRRSAISPVLVSMR